jgi:hypothetical protein
LIVAVRLSQVQKPRLKTFYEKEGCYTYNRFPTPNFSQPDVACNVRFFFFFFFPFSTLELPTPRPESSLESARSRQAGRSGRGRAGFSRSPASRTGSDRFGRGKDSRLSKSRDAVAGDLWGLDLVVSVSRLRRRRSGCIYLGEAVRRWVCFRIFVGGCVFDPGVLSFPMTPVMRSAGSTGNDGRLQAARRVRRGVLLHVRIRPRTRVCVIWGAGWVLPA